MILFDATRLDRVRRRGPRRAAEPALADLAPLLRRLESESLAAWRRAVPLRPQVAILHSMPSTRLHWLLDTRYDGASWFNRLTSYENEQSSEALNREAWAAMLSDLGLSYRFVTPRELREGALPRTAPLALVLPRAIAMSDAEVAAVAKFAESRLVIADCQLALFTSRLQMRDEARARRRSSASRARRVRGIDDLVAQEPDRAPPARSSPPSGGSRPTGASPMQTVGHGARSSSCTDSAPRAPST